VKIVNRRYLLIAAGILSSILGIVGIFVPVLPTTPFLLLAAACFVRSSDRLYDRLLSNRLFGNYIRNYIEGRGLPINIKIITITLLWITISISIIFGVQNLIIRIILVIIALAVSFHIIKIKTRK
jgi:uncharacterized membrane protein YbaN (DUF454 family)